MRCLSRVGKSGDETCYESPRERRQPQLTEARKRLMVLGVEVLVACSSALKDPKNVAKGDLWREMAWTELSDLEEDEGLEMREAAMDGDRQAAISEAGQRLAFALMQLDKMEE